MAVRTCSCNTSTCDSCTFNHVYSIAIYVAVTCDVLYIFIQSSV